MSSSLLLFPREPNKPKESSVDSYGAGAGDAEIDAEIDDDFGNIAEDDVKAVDELDRCLGNDRRARNSAQSASLRASMYDTTL
jgi:hypothetical protein